LQLIFVPAISSARLKLAFKQNATQASRRVAFRNAAGFAGSALKV